MSIPDLILSLPIWWLNGLLAVVYWLLAHLEEFAALLAGLILVLGVDPVLQARAGERPRRHGRGEVRTTRPNSQLFTLLTLAAWLGVSLVSQFPLPLIGTLLWWLGLLAVIAVPEERLNQLWWVRAGILTYAGLVCLWRIGLGMMGAASPADWAAMMGGRAQAQVILSSTRGNLASLGMLFVFAIYPLGYAGLLFNRFLRNPKPLYNLGLEAGEVIRRLRTRES